ncbi:MAG: response regulator transcription factor [Butyrivibrio sp.]|nr:response regulator transcription factor [Butyrivibrio sp.]
MSNKIFIVEDDFSICEMVGNYLSSENFTVDIFHNGSDALKAFQADDNYALALIDLMLPDMSGMEIIKEIRKTSIIPIIILTAKDNDTDKTMGLNLGADDYVVKPFSLIELTARIKANIRRADMYGSQSEQAVIKIKDLEINPSTHTAKVSGVSLDLTRTEFEILNLLASYSGQAFSKERLYGLIWKEPYFENENVLNTHINRLRAKLKKASNSDTTYIKTLWGIGYKMEEK